MQKQYVLKLELMRQFIQRNQQEKGQTQDVIQIQDTGNLIIIKHNTQL